MNNKGQINVGGIILVAICIIVGLVLYGAIIPNVDKVTRTYWVNNETVSPTTGLEKYTLNSCKSVSGMIVINRSDSAVIPSSGNWTIHNNVILTDGTLGATINFTAAVATDLPYVKNGANLTYLCEPNTYGDSGSRAIASIILILSVLAIVIVALYPTLKEKFS